MPRQSATEDPSRWTLLAIDSQQAGAVRDMSGALSTFGLKIDSAGKNVTLTLQGKRPSTSTFRYEQPSPDELVLFGDEREQRRGCGGATRVACRCSGIKYIG